jgi:hypothetical protein
MALVEVGVSYVALCDHLGLVASTIFAIRISLLDLREILWEEYLKYISKSYSDAFASMHLIAKLKNVLRSFCESYVFEAIG